MHPRVRLALMAAASLVLVGALLVALVASPGGAEDGRLEGSLSAPDVPVRDFALHDQDGRPVRLRDYRGQVVVLTFMYSTCRDTCPLMASTIGIALSRLERPVPALAVSVDPVGDTPARARRFLLERLLVGQLDFLLGTRRELAPIWKAYAVAPQGPEFDHSAAVLVLDRDGRQRVSFPADKLTPEALAHDVALLVAERA